MIPIPEQCFSGTVLWTSPELLLAARGRYLLRSDDGGTHWRNIARLELDALTCGLAQHAWLRRLGRREVHHAVRLSSGRFLLCAYRGFHLLDLEAEEVQRLPARWYGGRPLALCVAGGRVFYGEYRSNVERSPVAVWCSEDEGRSWERAWTFSNVRHVHGVFHDPYEDAIWVTTGDLDHECGLWRTTDDFNHLEQRAGGNQTTRIVQPLFTPKTVLFGSDAPTESNYIYCLDRESSVLTSLAQVGGPVFYGFKVNERCYFSTAVEPGAVRFGSHATVWQGGDRGMPWRQALRFRKDFLSMRWFQYGQVLFPSSQSTGSKLWLTPYATSGHQVSLCYDVATLINESS